MFQVSPVLPCSTHFRFLLQFPPLLSLWVRWGRSSVCACDSCWSQFPRHVMILYPVKYPFRCACAPVSLYDQCRPKVANDKRTPRSSRIAFQMPALQLLAAVHFVSSRCLITSLSDLLVSFSNLHIVRRARFVMTRLLAAGLRQERTGFLAGGVCARSKKKAHSATGSTAAFFWFLAFMRDCTPGCWRLWHFSRTGFLAVRGCAGLQESEHQAFGSTSAVFVVRSSHHHCHSVWLSDQIFLVETLSPFRMPMLLGGLLFSASSLSSSYLPVFAQAFFIARSKLLPKVSVSSHVSLRGP